MATEDLAAALQRAETVLRRRPDMGLHDDAPATARWDGDTRVVASHANGTQVSTDMPGELGGTAIGSRRAGCSARVSRRARRRASR